MKLFTNLWRFLAFALGCASLTLTWQIFDLSRSVDDRWHHHWLLADGISHLLFLAVLLVMMYLWAPHKENKKYAYSQQANDRDADTKDAWADEDLPGEDEDDTFWAETHAKGNSI